ncbi:hypothetical protein BCV70DRAFT_201419 [Testicularia cyperi]|uniref:RRM domain-containing protein n=1 Tax=Testicularia cyperi TaxID=1882483 RepID=A0A317XLM2_9BASI|nr:hypothetical protein BCV70DRAFT_201419 [Testicularia cyperi]
MVGSGSLLRPALAAISNLSPVCNRACSTSLAPPSITASRTATAAFTPPRSLRYLSTSLVRRQPNEPNISEFDTATSSARPFRTVQGDGARTRSKVVLLAGLPLSVTPNDLKSLAPGVKIHNAISRIEYIYTRLMRPSGKALVSFTHPIHAQNFAEACQQRILGGKMMRAQLLDQERHQNLLDRTYGNWPARMQIPFDLIEYETGKLVLLRNIPQYTTEARLEERLAPRYDLREQDRWRGKRRSRVGILRSAKGFGGSHDAVLGGVLKLDKPHQDATVTSFIVRCKSPQEAMRLVRRWHNTYFAPATFGVDDTGGRYRVEASILY